MALAFKGMVQQDKLSSGLSPSPYQELFRHCLSLARQGGVGIWVLLINLEN